MSGGWRSGGERDPGMEVPVQHHSRDQTLWLRIQGTASISNSPPTSCPPMSATTRCQRRNPNLIGQVYSALKRVSAARRRLRRNRSKPAVPIKRSITAEYIVCLEDGHEIQIAQAPSAYALQHDARSISREVGPAAGLSDGGAEICRGALATRQADGARPAAPPPAKIAASSVVIIRSALQARRRARLAKLSASPTSPRNDHSRAAPGSAPALPS